MLGKAGGDPKDQNNLSKMEKFHFSLCKHILGVKNNTTSSKMLGELRERSCYFRKVFNEELTNK